MTSWRRTTVHLKKYVFFNSQLRLKLRKNVELFDSPLPRTGLRVPVRVDVRGRRARHGARALPSRRARRIVRIRISNRHCRLCTSPVEQARPKYVPGINDSSPG